MLSLIKIGLSSCKFSSNRVYMLNYGIGIRYMAGHSKWQNIRHIKAQKDSEKQKVFQKISRMIQLAVKEGVHTDPSLNYHLARAIEQAKNASMPMASIESAIKSAKNTDSKSYLLEYKGPGTSFFLVNVVSSNITKTRGEINHTIKRLLCKEMKNSCRHMFDEKGIIITAPQPSFDTDKVTEHAIESGAEDVFVDDDNITLLRTKQELQNLGYSINTSTVEYLPNMISAVSDSDFEEVQKIVQKIEEQDDVMKVYVNL